MVSEESGLSATELYIQNNKDNSSEFVKRMIESIKDVPELAKQLVRDKVVYGECGMDPQYVDSLCTSQEHVQKTEEFRHIPPNTAGGMYNDAQMRHVRPEHDFRKPVSCSVIPWMSA